MTQIDDLHSIDCAFEKVAGNIYHVYEKDSKKYLSMLSPDDWNGSVPHFVGLYIESVYYDYDKTFKSIQS